MMMRRPASEYLAVTPQGWAWRETTPMWKRTGQAAAWAAREGWDAEPSTDGPMPEWLEAAVVGIAQRQVRDMGADPVKVVRASWGTVLITKAYVVAAQRTFGHDPLRKDIRRALHDGLELMIEGAQWGDVQPALRVSARQGSPVRWVHEAVVEGVDPETVASAILNLDFDTTAVRAVRTWTGEAPVFEVQ